MRASEVVAGLTEAGIKSVVTVPDSKFLPLLEALNKDQRFSFTIATNEGEGVAIAAGLWLSGSRAAVVMEGPGLFLATSALQHLGLFHGIPTVILISLRGLFGDNYWWFDGLARRILETLDTLDIQYEIVKDDSAARIRDTIKNAQMMADARKKPSAILFGVGLE